MSEGVLLSASGTAVQEIIIIRIKKEEPVLNSTKNPGSKLVY